MSENRRRVRDVWNWLPAFRAVAETEHLPSASEMVHVSASALSRAVGRLEEYFGHELFDREGRSMRLNDRGRRLLRAVRSGMRSVDDAIEANLDETFRGALHWTSSWSLSSVTLEALTRFTDAYPDVVPKMHTLEPAKLDAQLLQGEIDVAVLTSSYEVDGVHASHLGVIPHSVYCGRTHPLHGRDDVGWDELEGRRFAAPLRRTDGGYLDGWPPDRERSVVMEFDRMAVGYRACRDQGLLAVLPDLVAYDEPGLWNLQAVEDDPRHAFAVYREPLDEPGPAETFAERVADVFANRTATLAET